MLTGVPASRSRRAAGVLVGVACLLAALVTAPPGAGVVGAATSAVQSVPPARILETRVGPDFTTFDGNFQGVGRTPGGTVEEVLVHGRAGVPGDADGVFLNVAAVTPDGPGYLTVFTCGITPPLAANVNYDDGDVASNAVFVEISANGRICIFTFASADIVVDVTGYTPAGSATTPIAPARLLEGRNGPDFTTVDGQFEGVGRTQAGEVEVVQVAGRADVPPDAEAVFLNVAVVFPNAPGYATVFPCDGDPPNAANVNYEGGDVMSNAAFAKLSPSGEICVFTLARAHLVVDVTGFTMAGADTQATAPKRALESRTGPDFTTDDGQFEGIGRRAGGTVTEVTIRGRVDVPADADAVFLNVVAVAPAGPGYLTVFPCGITPPLSASVNYETGGVHANAVLARIGALGRVCIFTFADVDLVIDVNGYAPINDGVPIPPPDDDYNYLYQSSADDAPYERNGNRYLGWDPCSTITYAINDNGGATAQQRAVLDDAILQVEQATGFDLVFLGEASGSMDINSVDANTPNGQAEAVFGFSNESLTPILAGGVIGIGGAGGGSGPNVQLINGKQYIVKGGYAIADMDDINGDDELLSTFIHEIAHMIGLDHVAVPHEVMFFQLQNPPRTAYNTGDLNGLYNIGAPQCTSGSGGLSRSAGTGPSITIDVART